MIRSPTLLEMVLASAGIVLVLLLIALRSCRKTHDAKDKLGKATPVAIVVFSYYDRLKNFLWGMASAIFTIVITRLMDLFGVTPGIVAWLADHLSILVPVLVF